MSPCSGCTDISALNYDQGAHIDDGSCTYSISGCTDPLASNYNSEANTDDGSCIQAITQDNIHSAVDSWVSSPESTEATFGHISDWDVSGITNMSHLFEGAHNFNDDISSWDVSSVTNMRRMFHGAYNALENVNLSNWDVSNVTNMHEMFYYTSIQSDLSSWDVSNVTNFYENV